MCWFESSPGHKIPHCAGFFFLYQMVFPLLFSLSYGFLLMYSVYILYSDGYDIYYIGHTDNLDGRIIRHNKGLERYTRKYRPWTLILAIEKDTRAEAMRLERKLKNLSRQRLNSFINKYRSS